MNSIECDLRPISLIPTINKLLTATIANWILDAISDKVDVKQFGAIKGRSTTEAIIDLLHQWNGTLDNGGSVRVLLIDYAKEFDHVDHLIVCRKLLSLGAPRQLVIWIHSFLKDRKQRVKIESTISRWLTLNGGIPEGSWLGPPCFLIMIYDTKLPLPVSKFVDDTTVTELVAKSAELSCRMQCACNELVQRSDDNKLNINNRKTKKLIMGQLYNSQVPTVNIQGEDIERVTKFKLLGVIVNQSLKWNDHNL